MRLVLDTNVVVSALSWGGIPRRLLLLGEDRRVTLFTSPLLWDELQGVLRRRKFARMVGGPSAEAVRRLLDRYRGTVNEVLVHHVPRVVAADPADDAVAATAWTARADAIVTGDKQLLALHP